MPSADPLSFNCPPHRAAAGGGRATDRPDATSRLPAGAHTRGLPSPRSDGDPTIAALLKLVAAPPDLVDAADGEWLDAGPGPGHWTPDEVDELTDRLDASVRDLRRLGAELRRAEDELQRLRERTQRLADALGACNACWGEDSGCPQCQGCGRPGRSVPDERLFAEVVMPAVRLVRLGERSFAEPGSERGPSRAAQGPTVANLYASALRGRGPALR